MTRAQRLTAARYLRLLASVENLSMLAAGDAEIRRALDSVDPIEARSLAAELRAEADGEHIPQHAQIPQLRLAEHYAEGRRRFHPESLDAHRVGA